MTYTYSSPPVDGVIFSCYCPEEQDHRIPRLHRAYGFAKALYALDGDRYHSFDWHCEFFNRRFYRWHDHKGNLTVYTAHDVFESTIQAIKKGWESVGESPCSIEFLEPGDDESFRSGFHGTHSYLRSWDGYYGVRVGEGKATGLRDVIAWCYENTPSFYYSHGDVMYFSEEDDAALFKMRW